MADEYDGRVIIDTELDNSGFEQGSDKLIDSMRGVERTINGLGATVARAFGMDRAAKLRVEPELPEPEEVAADVEKIERELPPVRPQLDSKEYDKNVERLQARTNKLMAEINRMSATTAQGFKSTSSVIAFNNRLDDTAEKIVTARQELEEFAEQQIPTDQYRETTAAIEKAEKALLKLYDKKDALEELGTSEQSKQWQRLQNDIEKAEAEVERYEMAADRMRETGEAFVDPAATEAYHQMAEDIERAEQALETNAALIRSERIDEAQLAVQTAQAALAEATTNRERRAATKELAAARAELEAAARIGMPAIAQPDASVWRRFGETVLSALTGARAHLQSFGQRVASMGSTVASATKKAVTGLKRLASAAKSFASRAFRFGGATDALGKLTKKLTGVKGMLMSRIKRTFISYLFNQIKESFNALAQFDARFDKSVSNLRNRTSELGANIMASFGGIIRQLEPYITKLIETMSSGVTKINAVLTQLRGESTMQVAVRQTDSYAASLDKTSAAADKARQAQEKLNATLTSIDEIHKLDAPTDDQTEMADTANEAKTIYQNVPVDSILGEMGAFGRAIADQIVQGIKSGDWKSAGEAISHGLNALVDTIDEKLRAARPKAEEAARDIADLLNGIVSGFDGYGFGEALADGLNLGISAANEFLKRFEFRDFGALIGDGITGAVRRFEWDTFGQMIGNGINGAINTARGIIEHTDWRGIGHGLATGFNNIVGTVDWANLAQTISKGIIGILNTISQTVREIDWQQLGRNVAIFLKNVDWSGVAKAVFEAIGAVLGGLAGFVWGLIKEAFESIKKWWYNTAYEDGKFSMEGLLKGIVKALKNLGTWVKKNIFEPFVNAFKDAFGISSPSKEMEPYGEFVSEGILNGIKTIFSGIATWVKSNILEPFTKAFKQAFRVVGGKAQELLDSGRSIADGIKDGVSNGWTSITTYLSEKKDELKKAGEGITGSIKQGISDKWDTVKEALDIDSLSQVDGSKMLEAGAKLVTNLKDGFTGGSWDGMVSNIWQRFGDLVSWFNNEGAEQFKDSGRYMIDGLDEGMRERFSITLDTVRNGGQAAVDAFNRSVGISSPSKVMAQSGRYFMDGLTEGIEQESTKTYAALRGITTGLVDEVNDAQLDPEVTLTTRGLDKVAEKLAAIAQTFRDIRAAFPDITAAPVPAAALGAIVPAATRVYEDDRSGGQTTMLLERLITRIEELEAAVADRPIHLESRVVLEQREIGRATADYNAGNSRVTNGNGGGNRW